jgi:hypothetical protein
MENPQLIQNFLEMLDKSGFPDERKRYWISRLGSEESNPDDERLFTEELQAHLKTLDDAIELTEAQISSDQARIAAMDAEALPYLQRLADAQPAYYEQAGATYRKDVLTAEKQMMTEVEGVRGQSQAEEIEAIRKKLLS